MASKVIKMIYIMTIMIFVITLIIEMDNSYSKKPVISNETTQEFNLVILVLSMFTLLTVWLINCCRQQRIKRQSKDVKDIVINIHIEMPQINNKDQINNQDQINNEQQIKLPLKLPQKEDVQNKNSKLILQR